MTLNPNSRRHVGLKINFVANEPICGGSVDIKFDINHVMHGDGNDTGGPYSLVLRDNCVSLLCKPNLFVKFVTL